MKAPAIMEYAIDRGLAFKGQKFSLKAAVRRMQVGDSILVRAYTPPSHKARSPNIRPAPSNATREYFRMNGFSLCYSHEGEPEGMVRVWRTA